MVSKNKLCPYSLKGLYRQLRIIRIRSGYPLNNFIKLNSSLFDRPRFSRCPSNSKRKGKLHYGKLKMSLF